MCVCVCARARARVCVCVCERLEEGRLGLDGVCVEWWWRQRVCAWVGGWRGGGVAYVTPPSASVDGVAVVVSCDRVGCQGLVT